MTALESSPIFHDHKSLIDFKYSLSIINNIYAQNVLDHYVFKKVNYIFLQNKKKSVE
jgi:hypothetical protein